MKSNYWGVIFFLIIIFTFSFSKKHSTSHISKIKKYPTGVGIPGYTGAPGEFNCADCHNCDSHIGASEGSLTIQDSLNINQSYFKPNNTYTLLFSQSMPIDKGFQLCVLNDLNQNAGHLIPIDSSVHFSTLKNREYVNHVDKTHSSWKFKWLSPKIDSGEVTFYVSSGNYQDIYLYKFKFASFSKFNTNKASLTQITNSFEFKAYFNKQENQILVSFNSLSERKIYYNISSLDGKILKYGGLGLSNFGANFFSIDVNDISSGNYIIQLFLDNDYTMKKIAVI